ncbi:hypothetical protein C9374_010961 [Naegleria lovaniensis]|uniref:Zn(2)-C6 fungal-type domain-containing protein n=1 Tax=Naegleria lovaniensis TaxID=51637 RepID=A0AA88KFU2_NAELO|nr:uncharacterized protein C9374_010961 [Naegleria lovaniensis]KAG2374391.1 hypothetical protein C9374_010961 [Naegleria lovaniensis]
MMMGVSTPPPPPSQVNSQPPPPSTMNNGHSNIPSYSAHPYSYTGSSNSNYSSYHHPGYHYYGHHHQNQAPPPHHMNHHFMPPPSIPPSHQQHHPYVAGHEHGAATHQQHLPPTQQPHAMMMNNNTPQQPTMSYQQSSLHHNQQQKGSSSPSTSSDSTTSSSSSGDATPTMGSRSNLASQHQRSSSDNTTHSNKTNKSQQHNADMTSDMMSSAATPSGPYSPTNTTFSESVATPAVDDTQGGQLAQIACTNCRSRHKKCTRELPVCTYCKKMGKPCIYLKSRKGQDQQNRKKRKKKKDASNEDPASNSTTLQQGTADNFAIPTITSTSSNASVMVPQQPHQPPSNPSTSMAPPSSVTTTVMASGTSGLAPPPIVTSSSNNASTTPHSVVANSSSSNSSTYNDMHSPLPSSAHGSSPLLTHHYNPMAYSERDVQDPTSISMVFSSFIHSMNFKITAHKLLDLYYKELCAGFALVDKGLMEGLIDQLMGNDGSSNNSTMILNHIQLDSVTQDGLISILYSIQALALQQSGEYVLKGDYRQRLMEFLHNAAKEKISKYFDNMDNIYVAVALHYLSDYLCGEGDFRKTSLYLAMVKQMIGLHGYGGPNDHQVGTASACYSSQDNPSLPKFLLRILVRYKETFLSDYMSKQNGGQANSASMKLFGVFASRVKLDTSFFDREKGFIGSQYLPHIEHVVQIAHTYYSLLFETMYQAQGDLFCIFSNVFIREFYLDLYSKVEKVPAEILLSFANDIISYTKMEKYIFAPYVIANGIAKAVSVRLEYWKHTYHPIDFRDDLRALKVLSTRYGVVQKLYGDLINQIENAILLQYSSNSSTERLLTSGLQGVNPPLVGMQNPISFASSQSSSMTQATTEATSSDVAASSSTTPTNTTEPEQDGTSIPSFDDSAPLTPLLDPFSAAGNANILTMLFNEVGNERGDSLTEESYFMDEQHSESVAQERDHNPFIKGYHLVKMMIKQLSRLKDALHIPETKVREESLKKAKSELIEELSKALPNDVEAKFILELTKHQHPQQIHPCQYSHLALLFE